MSYLDKFKRPPQSQGNKPKVLVAVLTGGERTNWLNPDLVLNLQTMWRDPRFEVYFFPVRDARPWEAARNMTIHAARQCGATWVISFDNDNFVQGNPLDIVASAGADKHVIGLTYAVSRGEGQQYSLFPWDGHGASNGPFREEEKVAGGVLMIRNTVWQTIPQGPWFRWEHATDNEVLAPGKGSCGEDVYFCRLVRQHGLKVWTHRQIIAGHYRTANISTLSGVK